MTLLICRTCPRYDPRATGQFGRRLTAALAQIPDNPIAVRNVQCLGGCPDDGVVAVDAPARPASASSAWTKPTPRPSTPPPWPTTPAPPARRRTGRSRPSSPTGSARSPANAPPAPRTAPPPPPARTRWSHDRPAAGPWTPTGADHTVVQHPAPWLLSRRPPRPRRRKPQRADPLP